MATVVPSRKPLAVRPHPQHAVSLSPFQATLKRTMPAAIKRPRSPEPAAPQSAKRAKQAQAPSALPHTGPRDEQRREKDRKRVEREEEFRVKYTKAFPRWVFYFDVDSFKGDAAVAKLILERRVLQMGARVDDFLSNEITHVVTCEGEDPGKENVSQTINPTALLGSPIKLKGRESIVKIVAAWNARIWSPAKLDSVLDRCHAPQVTTLTREPSASAAASKERSLSRLLQHERVHGTAERDPTQKRHDYKYFSKNSYFVLIEDMREELATIAAFEYPITKGHDGTPKGAWPVLYCHPLARGPFVPYDEKEERRRERVERADRERVQERARRKAKLREQARRREAQQAAMQAQAQHYHHDLRRTASMNNLRRSATMPSPAFDGLIDLDAEEGTESANASGYLASGAYMAASGNSVGITSTAGMTSTMGLVPRMRPLPAALKGRYNQQVVTSRRVSMPVVEGKENRMGPPVLPERAHVLRKSKSTNTMRLPKREEGEKPGYCESCRVKFESFKQHIVGRRHRKFADDDANFAQLDAVLSRVKRQTRAEVEAEQRLWKSRRNIPDSEGDSEQSVERWAGLNEDEDERMDPPVPEPGDEDADGEDVPWDEWVAPDGM